MMLITTLALLGLFFVYLEFFFPSGILAIFAALSFFGSVIFFIMQQQSWLWIVAYTLLLGALAALVSLLALSRVKRKVAHRADQEGYTASSFDKELMGASGVCLTDLKPTGYVLIKEKSYSAYSLDGYIHKDTPVIVVGGKGSDLQVNLIKRS